MYQKGFYWCKNFNFLWANLGDEAVDHEMDFPPKLLSLPDILIVVKITIKVVIVVGDDRSIKAHHGPAFWLTLYIQLPMIHKVEVPMLFLQM